MTILIYFYAAASCTQQVALACQFMRPYWPNRAARPPTQMHTYSIGTMKNVFHCTYVCVWGT